MSEIHLAVKHRSKSVIRNLLRKGISVDTLEDGRTPLCMAAAYGDEDMIRFLIRRGAHPTTVAEYRATALHYAAAHGHLDAARLLISRGARIDAKTSEDDLPLHFAVGMRWESMVQFLLEEEAIILRLDSDNSGFGRTDVKARNSATAALHRAVKEGHSRIVGHLIRHGADISARDSNGEAPLHIAVTCGFLDVVQLLLDEGAEVDERTSQGVTPLLIALATEHQDIEEILLHRGANPDLMANFLVHKGKIGDGEEGVEIFKMLPRPDALSIVYTRTYSIE